MAYFPLFMNLEGKEVWVIGGGAVASRRIRLLAEFGCDIFVLSPEISDGLDELVKDGRVKWIQDEYHGQILKKKNETKPFFVLAAAAESVNQQVVNDCRALGILVNDASNKDNCDFYFPGLIKDGDVVVGVTAGGSDHKLAAALSAKIRELVKK